MCQILNRKNGRERSPREVIGYKSLCTRETAHKRFLGGRNGSVTAVKKENEERGVTVPNRGQGVHEGRMAGGSCSSLEGRAERGKSSRVSGS